VSRSTGLPARWDRVAYWNWKTFAVGA